MAAANVGSRFACGPNAALPGPACGVPDEPAVPACCCGATAGMAWEVIDREKPVCGDAADLIVGEGVGLPDSGGGRGTAVPGPDIDAAGQLSVIASRDLYTSADAAALRHPEADKLHRYDRIQVSEPLARARGLVTGDRARIRAGETAITAPITVSDRVPDNAVYVSSLLQGGAPAGLFASGPVPSVELEPAAADRPDPVPVEDTEPTGSGPFGEAAGHP